MPSLSTARSLLPRNRADLARRAVEVGFASWFTVTVLSQHPHRVFDRLRAYDKVGLLIPNWRFFAPQPARHDFHLLYRTLSSSGEQSAWQAASKINPRNWSQVVWFPGRRQEKAVFDICNEITGRVGQHGVDITQAPAYLLLRDFVIRHIQEEDPRWPDVRGFQFLIVQYSGHDDSEDPQYAFISPFVPLGEGTSRPDPDRTDDRTDDQTDDRLESAA